jgi:hypothetical protein
MAVKKLPYLKLLNRHFSYFLAPFHQIRKFTYIKQKYVWNHLDLKKPENPLNSPKTPGDKKKSPHLKLFHVQFNNFLHLFSSSRHKYKIRRRGGSMVVHLTANQ